MDVICPGCKIKLKIDEEKLTSRGAMFKCPMCRKVFIVKKPSALSRKEMDQGKILVAHSNPAIINEITSLLTENGYRAVTSSDGIDAIIKAIKEHPFLTIIEADLPKINGLDVCRRISSRAETKEKEFLFVVSAYDERYRKFPSLCGAYNYIEDQHISELLIEKVNAIRNMKTEER